MSSENRRKIVSTTYNILHFSRMLPKKLPWIPEPSTVNNKLKRREGSGSTGRFFD
jgi:hypothetical protein